MSEHGERVGSKLGLKHKKHILSKGDLDLARQLSPRRLSSRADSLEALVREQLAHFGLDHRKPLGRRLAKTAGHLYGANIELNRLWPDTLELLRDLDRSDRIAYFNAKRFLCFQLAKLLDTLHLPMRKSYQSLVEQPSSRLSKGPYSLFDNITAIFSGTPVITRTSTYLYACTEWIDEAFKGKELLHEIYSRLMNPTSVCLANHIVDVEAGSRSGEYFAWNFNSGMAAIDGILSHLLGYRDILLSSRNVYGGTWQLMHDWFGRESNMNVGLTFFDGTGLADFKKALEQCRRQYADRLQEGRQIYVFLESPCNPHGYVLDVPAICRLAHAEGLTVICDSTVGTPFLQPTLQRDEACERPDFVVHSYTKDLVGSGTTTAGVVIGRNERMFLPKGESVEVADTNGKIHRHHWNDTLFWNVYFIKGAFLDSEKAFEVLTGMRTLELRMLRKCISTRVLAEVLNRHPDINVHCAAVPGNENYRLCRKLTQQGFPAPLFTIDFEAKGKTKVQRETFKRFFDCLEPAFGLQVSLGQVNTVVLCPAMTSHSELSEEALRDAGITPTTIRIAVGDEDPRVLLAHFLRTAQITLEKDRPGFTKKFPRPAEIDRLYRKIYLDGHRRFIDSRPDIDDLMK